MVSKTDQKRMPHVSHHGQNKNQVLQDAIKRECKNILYFQAGSEPNLLVSSFDPLTIEVLLSGKYKREYD